MTAYCQRPNGHRERRQEEGKARCQGADKPAPRPPGARNPPRRPRRSRPRQAAKARKRQEGRRRRTTGPPCRVEGCKQPVRAKGYCRKHFMAWRRGAVGDHHRYKICSKEACRKPRTKGGLCDEHAGIAAPPPRCARPRPARRARRVARGRRGLVISLQKIVINGGARLRARCASPARRTPRCRSSRRRCSRAARSTFRNVPALDDVRTMGRLLARLGADVTDSGKGVTRIDTTDAAGHEAPYELVKTMRASRARARAAGGALRARRACRCRAAARSARGRSISTSRASRRWAPRSRSSTATSIARRKRLRGAQHRARHARPSPARENLMMAAALAKGRTDARERRARAGGRGARRACSTRWARGSSGAGTSLHHDRGRRRAARRSSTRSSPTASRPARFTGRGGDHPRRRAAARLRCPSTSTR